MGKIFTFALASRYCNILGIDCYAIIFRDQDLNNYESDPEDFARTFCKDLSIDDPEVGVSEAFCIMNIS